VFKKLENAVDSVGQVCPYGVERALAKCRWKVIFSSDFSTAWQWLEML